MKSKPKLKFPRVPVPKPSRPHKVKKGGKPKHTKRDDWDGDQFFDNLCRWTGLSLR